MQHHMDGLILHPELMCGPACHPLHQQETTHRAQVKDTWSLRWHSSFPSQLLSPVWLANLQSPPTPNFFNSATSKILNSSLIMERAEPEERLLWLRMSLEEKIGASPVDRDPGLADLKIQLPGSMKACLFGVREEPGQASGLWRSTWLCPQRAVDLGRVMLHSRASASSPWKQGVGPSECSTLCPGRP